MKSYSEYLAEAGNVAMQRGFGDITGIGGTQGMEINTKIRARLEPIISKMMNDPEITQTMQATEDEAAQGMEIQAATSGQAPDKAAMRQQATALVIKTLAGMLTGRKGGVVGQGQLRTAIQRMQQSAPQ